MAEYIDDEEEQRRINKLVMLKMACKEEGIDLKEYLLCEIAEELKTLRILKEYEGEEKDKY